MCVSEAVRRSAPSCKRGAGEFPHLDRGEPRHQVLGQLLHPPLEDLLARLCGGRPCESVFV
eukprot:15242823-Heterocapsa_arctica.AAC.1